MDREPDLIFGTWPLKGEDAYRAVLTALEVGYRRLDTARFYGNETEVGRAILHSGLPRAALSVTTKVTPGSFNRLRFFDAVEQSLDRLRVGPVDLLLMHWPPRDEAAFDEAVDLLNEARQRGSTVSIGLSNCTVAQMRCAAARSSAAIAVNQVELHPLLNQRKVQNAASELSIQLQGYCSLGRGQALGQPVCRQIAADHGVSEATVLLAWALAEGVSPVTMTTRRENAQANLAARKVALTQAQIEAIGALRGAHLRVVREPRFEPEWDAP